MLRLGIFPVQYVKENLRLQQRRVTWAIAVK